MKEPIEDCRDGHKKEHHLELFESEGTNRVYSLLFYYSYL
jgi:hypothetical protein